MDTSIFTGQIQSVMQKLMFTLMERLFDQLDGTSQTQNANPLLSASDSTSTSVAPSGTAIT